MRALALAALVLAAPASGQVYASDRGTVTFTSRVPLHTFTGTSDRLDGEVDIGTGALDFYVDLETLETGIGRRDRDLRETLETDRFPFAEFSGRLTAPFDTDRPGRQPVTASGTFTLHGIARPLAVAGTLERVRGGLRLRAAWTVRLDDHDITPPRLLMVKVDEEQAVAIDVVLRAQ